ncbi:MAG: hypothetical protein ACOCQ3_01330 [Natronomonas sp.]
MSSENTTFLSSLSFPGSRPRELLNGAGILVVEGVRVIAFWATVLVPIVALAAVASGFASTNPTALLGLLALAGLSAIVGHKHVTER